MSSILVLNEFTQNISLFVWSELCWVGLGWVRLISFFLIDLTSCGPNLSSKMDDIVPEDGRIANLVRQLYAFDSHRFEEGSETKKSNFAATRHSSPSWILPTLTGFRSTQSICSCGLELASELRLQYHHLLKDTSNLSSTDAVKYHTLPHPHPRVRA